MPVPDVEEPPHEPIVRAVLEQELQRVQTPEAAEVVLDRAEKLAAGATEQDAGQRAADGPPAAVAVTREAAAAPGPRREAAAVLVETAAQSVAPQPTAPAVVQAAQQALGTQPAAVPPAARRGRDLLREAVLRRMGPAQALDARVFLAINCLPHPSRLDRLANLVTLVTTGGWIWVGAVLVARRLGAPRGRAALHALVPTMTLSTWLLEYPIKALFRRRRPFIEIVRALVVGKKPGSWSFPSGHTAASFATAWLLSPVWPKASPLFYAIASTVGFSRVYVGAHYPGDVMSGATLGLTLAETIRQAVKRIGNKGGS